MLLLAHGLVAPGSALAGCDNHGVTSQADRQLDLSRLDDLIIGGPSATIADETGRSTPRSPRPCSGPGCSNSVPRPTSTATPVTAGPDQWVALRGVSHPVVASPSRLVPDDAAARPVGHRPSIFHPPPS